MHRNFKVRWNSSSTIIINYLLSKSFEFAQFLRTIKRREMFHECHPLLLPSQKSVFVWHSIVFKTNSWSCSYCVLSATCGGTYQYLLSFRRGTRFPFGRSGCHRCGHTKWADGLVHVQKFFVRHLHDDVVLQIGFVLIIYKHHNIFCSVVSGWEKVTLGFRNCTNIRRPKIE